MISQCCGEEIYSAIEQREPEGNISYREIYYCSKCEDECQVREADGG